MEDDDEELRGELVPLEGEGRPAEDTGRVGDLKPIPEHVAPPCAELAAGLRGLFGAVGVSLRVFALRVYRDPGTVSRYLNGTVVAPAEFVDTLLTHAAKATGRPSSPEVITHVHGLQRRALQATNRAGWELQNLRDQLADADRQRQHAEVRAEALTEALQARKQRIAEMEIEQRQLAVSMSVERDGRSGRDGRGAEVELLRDERERLQGERDRLKEEVARLQGELGRARRQALEAERRCEELEHQLQAGEEAAAEQAEAEDPVAHRLWLAEEQASAAEERARRLEQELDRLWTGTAAPDPQQDPQPFSDTRQFSGAVSGQMVVGHRTDIYVHQPSPPGPSGGLPGYLPVTVTYAGPNRPWAAWVAQRLEATGVAREEITVRRWDPAAEPSADLDRAVADLLGDDAFHLLLLSEHFFGLDSARTEEEWEAALESVAVRQRADRIAAFVVSRHPLPVVVARLGAVGLLGGDEEECERRLLRALGVDAAPARTESGRHRSRLPGDPPELWDGVPRRNPTFTGRDVLLERINDFLRGAPAEAAVCALVGLPGIGKTQLAVEYAYRFGAEYDVVWWAAAHERGALEERLGGHLADLGKEVQGYSTFARVGAARDNLRRGVPSDRWLLVLDGADSPEAVADLLPGGRGHVLITSQNRGWGDHYVELLDVPPFSRDESVAFVRARAPRLGRQDAVALAAAVEDLPLPLDQTAAWLHGSTTAAEEYIGRLGEGGPVPVKAGAAYSAPYASAFKELIRRLQTHSQLAADLLQLCAVFGPGPVPLALLRAVPGELVSPALASLLEDPTHFEVTVGKLVQHSAVRREAEVLQLHRFVCDAVRRRRPDDRRDKDARVIRHALVAARPGPPEYPATWPRYAELVPYLEWSGGRLGLDCLTYLTLRGDYATALRLVDKVTDAPALDGELILRCTALLRATGNYARAERLDRGVLDEADEAGSPAAMNALSADLRGLGRYAEAYELCQRQADLSPPPKDGPDHLRARAELAASLRALGHYQSALDVDEPVLERRRAILGSDHLETLASETDYAWDLLMTGRYTEALAHQSRSVERHHAAVGSETPHTLSAECALAVCRLNCGEVESGTALLAVVLDRARRLLGEAAPLSLLIASHYSCALGRRGRLEQAREVGDFVTDAYRATLGDLHPYAGGAAANSGLLLLEQGEDEQARAVLEKALTDMTAALGEDHPWTLGVAVNTAAAYQAVGDRTDACALSREASLRAGTVLGQRHPLTLTARLALAADLREIKGGRDEAWAIERAAIDDLRDVLGEPDHPQVVAAREHVRPLWDFAPLPV
ncbi:FxSxx-COOH system tetratricopeptide repeat protein [Streptomyces sp. NPDC000941]